MSKIEINALKYALGKLGFKGLENESDQNSFFKELFKGVFGREEAEVDVLETIFRHVDGYSGSNTFLPVDLFHPFDSFPQELITEQEVRDYISKINLSQLFVKGEGDLNSIHYQCKELFGNLGLQGLDGGSLFTYLKSFVGLSKAKKESSDGEILFIGGDLSGIQSFIYNIISKYAAKNLKGRSFYLQLLADAAVLRLQHELEVSDFNLIYSSGGGFFMYCADNELNRGKLDVVRKEIEEELLAKHGLDLFFSIDAISMESQDFCSRQLSVKWSELIEKMTRRKKQKFKNQLITNYASFFEPIPTSKYGWRDAITNEEIYHKNDLNDLNDEEEEGYLKNITHFQIKLGKLLKSSQYLNYKITKKLGDEPNTIFGIKFLLGRDKESGYQYLKINPEPGERINNGIFYGGNSYPSNPDTEEPITFDELAKADGEGIERLGLLRMDVDNLGQLFIRGFASATHIAAYSELSVRLDGFFKGYLNYLVQTEEFKNKVIIMYSGGDDLFIAGAYQRVLQLAGAIRMDFQKWVGGGNQPGISGGLAIVGGKYPIIKGAEIAGVMEKTAKQFPKGSENPKKNAICLFGIPFSWDQEYYIVMGWKEKWIQWIENNTISKSILFKLMQYYDLKEQGKLKWQWNSLYTLHRNRNDRNKQEIEILKQEVLMKGANNYRALDLCVIGGRLAEISLRNN